MSSYAPINIKNMEVNCKAPIILDETGFGSSDQNSAEQAYSKELVQFTHQWLKTPLNIHTGVTSMSRDG